MTRWWSGPLDAQGLAWSAVGEAVAATSAVAAARGASVVVDTSEGLVAGSFAAIEHLRVDGQAPAAWAPLSGFVAARDGWVRLHANYPHHAAALGVALGVSSRAHLERAVAALAALEVETRVREAGGIAVAVRTPQEWAEHGHGSVTAAEPWVRVEAESPRPALPPLSSGARPLAGVRVLDLTRVIAGPTCSQLLACLGADVLRVDPPHRPELLDQYLSNGMGKRSAELDLRADAAVLHERLLPSADVLLLGYRPGSLARFGLDPDALRERYPGLVVGSLSAWGETGPWAQRPGFDSIVQAASGIATICASCAADRGADPSSQAAPGALPVQALDHASGYVLAARVLDLLARARAGIVRISLLGAARTLMDLPAPPPGDVVAPQVPLVDQATPHGRLTAVPPPIRLDGRTIEAPITGYGAAEAVWAQT